MMYVHTHTHTYIYMEKNGNKSSVIVFNWNHFDMRFLNLRIFIYCRLFVLILVFFSFFLCVVSLSLRFGQISPLAFFRWFTATSDRNAEPWNRIPSNYCLPLLLSIAPRFWLSKPLAALGRIWNHYLLTMLNASIRCATGPERRSRMDVLVL